MVVQEYQVRLLLIGLVGGGALSYWIHKDSYPTLNLPIQPRPLVNDSEAPRRFYKDPSDTLLRRVGEKAALQWNASVLAVHRMISQSMTHDDSDVKK